MELSHQVQTLPLVDHQDIQLVFVHLCADISKSNSTRMSDSETTFVKIMQSDYFYEIRHCKDKQVSERMGMRNMSISHKRTHCQRLNWNAKEQPSERHEHHLHGTTKPTSITTHILGLRKRFDQTVRNRLRETGIFPRRPMRRNVFTPSHLAEVPAEGEMGACQVEDCFVLRRESFSPVTCWWTRSRWRTVLFSDENRFLLSRGDGSSRV